jgi:hypothetical protein
MLYPQPSACQAQGGTQAPRRPEPRTGENACIVDEFSECRNYDKGGMHRWWRNRTTSGRAGSPPGFLFHFEIQGFQAVEQFV